jgi:hypothetical protein
MTRQQRQLDELRELCRTGFTSRAVDLAFEHVASFGRDEQVMALLRDAIQHEGSAADVRARLAELADE